MFRCVNFVFVTFSWIHCKLQQLFQITASSFTHLLQPHCYFIFFTEGAGDKPIPDEGGNDVPKKKEEDDVPKKKEENDEPKKKEEDDVPKKKEEDDVPKKKGKNHVPKKKGENECA